MTLIELLDAVRHTVGIQPSRMKDLKTSIRYLARALGAISPEALPNAEALAGFHRGRVGLAGCYRMALDEYFASLEPPPSAHTVRNTLNNLSFLYHTAYACNIINAFSERPRRQSRRQAVAEASRTSPYKDYMNRIHAGPRYWLPPDCWPSAIRTTWTRYADTRRLEIRSNSLQQYEQMLQLYVGYCAFIEQTPLTCWDDLFDADRLARLVRWHAQRVGARRVTHTGEHVVRVITMLARYEKRPELPALQALASKLPTPEPMHDKQHPAHSIDPKELEDIGLTMRAEAQRPLRSTDPKQSEHPGSQRAIQCQIGLILRLLVRVPMRQRSIREMQRGRNLYQDPQGVWQLRFQGDELKIRERRGRLNTFAIRFPDDLVDHLEEFLQAYRPLIPNARTSQYVFLSLQGNPYSQRSLWRALHDCVFARLGKRFYPHLIRTIWTDAYLLHTHDVSTAAFMLNDRPETVLQRYHELRANDHIQKAYQFNKTLLSSVSSRQTATGQTRTTDP